MHPLTTYAQVDLDAIAANVRLLADRAHGAEMFAVVKANAYGHGALQVARTALESGASRLAVARIDEGIVLRNSGLTAPVLIMGYALPDEIAQAADHDLTPTVYTIDAAEALSARARVLGKTIKVHVKIDSGMGRAGILPEEAVVFVEWVAGLPHLIIEGLYTHFASADESDKTFTHQQFETFMDVAESIKAAGVSIPMRHAANSAAVIDLPDMRLDAVRCGVAMYGLRPSPAVSDAVELRPALSLITHVARVRTLPSGSSVGYGRTFIAEKSTTVALLPVGYGDGVHRALSNKGHALIHGQRAPIIGRVSMDQITVDVSAIEGVQQDDEAVLIGAQGSEQISADEVAEHVGTINYEVTTSLLPRLPRIYTRSGEWWR
jgi:alanine racemase